jgi:cell division transport system permease protein
MSASKRASAAAESKTSSKRPRRNTRAAENSTLANQIRVHRGIVKASLKRLRAAPVASILTIFVIAVSLLLPSLLFNLNSNLSFMLAGFEDNAQLTLYLEDDISNARGIEVSDNLLTRDDIRNAVYISPSQALNEFARSTGLENLLQELDQNPLPAAIIVTAGNASPLAVEALATELRELAEVALIQVDSRWLQRLAAISNLLTRIGQVLAIIVVLGLFFIVGNTIRLAIENRRAEIRVIKLVGGSDMFAARPFLYSGLFYGFGGGLFAVLLQIIVLFAINSNFELLIQLYESDFQLQGFGFANAALLIVSGAAVGLLAA